MADDPRAPVTWRSGLVLAVLLALTAAAFGWMMVKSRQRAWKELSERPLVVSLGEPFVRPVDDDRFLARVSLKVDATRPEAQRVREELEARRPELRSIVLLEILGRRRDDEFRRPAVEQTLKLEIRDRVNRELARAGLDAPVVDVVFEDLVKPVAK